MTFRMANVDGRTALVIENHWYDAETHSNGDIDPDPMKALLAPRSLRNATARLLEAGPAAPDGVVADTVLGAPVPRPINCFAIGLNYQTHVDESGIEAPDVPLVFTKFPSCITGPDTSVDLNCEHADYEVELVAVIGSQVRHATKANARQAIVGLTAGNDLSDRKLQFSAKPPHFDLGKSRDGYGPIGPVLASLDSFTDPNDLALTCSVNGEVRQDDRTSSLIFDLDALIVYLSSFMTLQPGDLIFTGTPAGVGGPAGNFLRPGDVVEATVEGIGTITSTCR